MRSVKDRALHAWEARRAEANDPYDANSGGSERIQRKRDKLDEAFLFAQTIDATGYQRQCHRLQDPPGFGGGNRRT
jgi:hypothetical protein